MTGPPIKSCRVLVVEDSQADIDVIKIAFDECGYPCELTFTRSHAEAEHFLASQPSDLLLSDFGADYQSLSRFVESVRSHSSTVPIVVLSSFFDPSLAYGAGANAFVRKEGDLQRFSDKIQGIMRFWIDVAELPSARRI